MTFNALFIAHAPDAVHQKHRCSLETRTYHLHVVLVKSQAEALAMIKEYARKERLDSILLCPGFSHGDVAAIAAAAGSKTGVVVARGDGPGSRVTQIALQRAGMIPGK
jgi:hypothetical protein